MKSIKQIMMYSNCRIGVRVNFSRNTFDKLEELVDDLDFCDKQRLSISLHKVWQTDEKTIDQTKVFDFIRYANSKNITVNYMTLQNAGGRVCYADRHNQAVINYDGFVYKCTARDFNEENSEGVLNENGTITWDSNKRMNRMSVRLSDECLICKLLPSCPGICTQKRMERPMGSSCILGSAFSASDYIVHNFNNQIARQRIIKQTKYEKRH